jgi:uncharacterized membrane protein YphA (DoxX/SURF4 family)
MASPRPQHVHHKSPLHDLGVLVARLVLGVVYAAVMAGAMFFAHLGNGFYASEGGFEFVLVLAGLSLALACIGAGRYSVDGAVGRRWRARQARSLPATAETA